MASETTPDAPREAVRPAVPQKCAMTPQWTMADRLIGKPAEPTDFYDGLVVDNSTGGGLVARVRAAVDRILPDNDWTVSQREDAVERGVATILAALGVQP